MRFAVACFLSLFAACAPRPIMTWPEYERVRTSWPYVLEIGNLYYFGAEHAYDPAHPQNAKIEAAWEAFKPDIAFTEGGSPPLEKTKEEAIRKAGESGLVRFLAARDNVPVTTLDPTRAEEVAVLSSRFTREQIKLWFLVRAAAQFAARNPREKIDAEMERILAIYAGTSGLNGSPRNVAEIEETFARLLPGHGDYRDAKLAWFDPVRTDTFFNEMSRAGSHYRDQFVVDRLVGHVKAGRRVLAVMGGSHVVMQEAALRSRLR
jgi:hypothetical protein